MANGNFGGGTGTPEDPYLVEDDLDFNAIRAGLAMSYKLVNDIDLANLSIAGTGFVPMGTFTGTLDGNFKTIRNMIQERGNVTYHGIFNGLTSGATVRNMTLEGFRINATEAAPANTGGALCGTTFGAAIVENIVVTDFVCFGFNIGGLIGYINSPSVHVRNCVVTDTVKLRANAATNAYVGGLVGRTNAVSTINYCISEATILNPANLSFVGAVVGGTTVSTIFNYNYWNTDRTSVSGTSVPTGVNQCTGLSTVEMKNHNNFITSGSGLSLEDVAVNDRGFRSYIIDTTLQYRPRLFFEKGINLTQIIENSDSKQLIHFGNLLEGADSSSRTLRIKPVYDVRVNNITLSWARRPGVVALSEIVFSTDPAFSNPVSELTLTDLDLAPGDEVTVYMRIKSLSGMNGDGIFDLYVDVSS